MRLFEQTYRALLRMLRVGRSEEDVSAIVADGRQLLADAQPAGRVAVVRLWLILFMDAVATGVRQDVSHALRLMARAPGFTLTASLTLALGLTATTTMFVLVNGVLLRPLPYKDPQRLLMLWESNPSLARPQDGLSPGNLLDLKERRPPFSHLAGWSTVKMTVRNGEGGIPVTASQVTEGFFDVFALSPEIGRTFSALEYRGVAVSRGSFGGHEPTLVLSHRLWQELGGDPAAVGGTLDLDGRPWRVIGVMPRDFDMPHQSMLWIPWDPRAAYPPDRFPAGPPRDFRFLRAAARWRRFATGDGCLLPQCYPDNCMREVKTILVRIWSARSLMVDFDKLLHGRVAAWSRPRTSSADHPCTTLTWFVATSSTRITTNCWPSGVTSYVESSAVPVSAGP